MALLLLALPSAFAATLTVGPSGADYSTIQAAIDAASDGDTVLVEAGDWVECLDFGGKDLSLVGAGSSSTTLQGDGSCEAVISLESGEEATVSGFTDSASGARFATVSGGSVRFEDIVAYQTGSKSRDGGVLEVDLADVEVEGCTFQDDLASSGAAIHLGAGSTLRVIDGSFLDMDAECKTSSTGDTTCKNDATASIVVDSTTSTPSSVAVEGSTFSGNLYLMAVYLGTGGTLESSDTVYEHFFARGIWAGKSTVVSSVDDSFTELAYNPLTTGGAIASSGGTSLSIDGSSFADCDGGSTVTGGASEVHVVGASFSGGGDGASNGGALALGKVTALVEDTTFSANSVEDWADIDPGEDPSCDSKGGAIYASGATLTIQGSTFEDNYACGKGGAIYAKGGSLTVEDSTFTGNSAGVDETEGGGGAVLYADTLSATLEACSFTDNEAGYYGAATFVDSSIDIAESSFVRNGGNLGGLSVVDATALDVSGSWFCHNDGSWDRAYTGEGGGARVEVVDGGVGGTWTNNAFIENTAEHGAGLAVHGASDLQILNNVFLGNSASQGGGLYVEQSGGAFTNNVVAWTVAGDGMYAADADSAAGLAVSYSDLYANTSVDAGGLSAIDAGIYGNLSVDPELANYSLDGDCTNDLLWLAEGSPLRDAGDPSILDPDASTSDIGLYGGPAAAAWDGDADGSDGWTDCDDGDPSVYPGAPEIAGDGVDQDCDGADAAVETGDDTGASTGDDTGVITGDDTGTSTTDDSSPESGHTDDSSAPDGDDSSPDSGLGPKDGGCACSSADTPGGRSLALLGAALLMCGLRRRR